MNNEVVQYHGLAFSYFPFSPSCSIQCLISPIFVSPVAPLGMAVMCFVGEEALFQLSI